MTTTFHKGPLGWGVNRDGKLLAMIRKTRVGYQVAVVGWRPGDGKGSHLYRTLAQAKRAAAATASTGGF